MSDVVLDAPEVILCDTSYLGAVRGARDKPWLTDTWPPEVTDRIAAAAIAISVVTVAEERAGEIIAGWGDKAVEANAQRRRSFILVPIDFDVVERWAALVADCRRSGNGMHDKHNDLWIVATAIERKLPLVTCDENQSALPGLAESVYLRPGTKH